MSRRGRRAARATAVTVALVTACALVAPAAVAAFTSPAPAVSSSFATATLHPASAAAAATSACTPVTGPVVVSVSWARSPSSFADGYEILRGPTSAGPFAAVGAVDGGATTAFDDSTAAFATTYSYIVRARSKAWRSAASGAATVTTPSPICTV